MKKYILVLIWIIGTSFVCRAQEVSSADMEIANLVSSGNWFALDERYPALKNDINYEHVKLMAEAMLAHNFNRKQEAVDLFTNLINNYQEQIGSDNALMLTEMALGDLERAGQYHTAQIKAKGIIDPIKAHGIPVDYSRLEDIYTRNLCLSKYDSLTLIRLDSNDNIVHFKTESTDKYLPTNQTINRYYIPVVHHNNTYHFMFDTGANITYLSKRMADKLGAERIGYSNQYGDYAYIDSLQIGSMVFKNVIALVDNGTDINKFTSIDAVLGMDVIQKADEIRIDNVNKRMIFPATLSPMPVYGRNLRNEGNAFSVKTSDNTGALNCFLDTGAETGFTYNYFEKHKNEFMHLSGTKEITSIGIDGVSNSMAVLVNEVKFNTCGKEHELNNVYVPYTKQGYTANDIVLGFDFFRTKRTVILNFKDMFMICK